MLSVSKMNQATLDGNTLLKMLQGAYANLYRYYKEINLLNVFPVPDGDTGTNMKYTLGHGMKAIAEKGNVPVIMQELAHGMLFAARGNSGVLLSQYFRGIALGLDGKEEVRVSDFASALQEGYRAAYEAAVVPVEGTILTVAREGIENALPLLRGDSSFLDLMESVSQAMELSLENTPELLPVLKSAGVIDSGGKGLLCILEGFAMALRGEDISIEGDDEEKGQIIDTCLFNENSTLEYGYCTEFLLQLLNAKSSVESFDIEPFIRFLQEHGDSVVCFQNGTIVKVHVHTKKPYEIIEFAQNYGEFVTFKMENMSLQHNEVEAKKKKVEKPHKKVGYIAFGRGAGVSKVFEDLGCDVVLDGGESMDIPVGEILSAIDQTNSDDIFLLPNNNNLILTASHVASLCNTCRVHVVETNSVQEGYFALSNAMMTNENVSEIEEQLRVTKELVYTGNIKKSQDLHGFSANLDGNTVGFSLSRVEAFFLLLESIPDFEEKEFLFVFPGEGVKEEEINEIKSKLEDDYPFLEVGFLDGGQSSPDYMVGVPR